MKLAVARCAIGAGLLALASSLPASGVESIQASYDVFRGNLRVATAQESFERKGNSYRLVSESTPTGLLAMFVRARIRIQSAGTVTASGLRPDQFEYARLDDASRNVQAVFDWRASSLRMSFDGKTESASLVAGVQDRLSLMYQFMFLPLDKLKTIPVHMTNGKKIESYQYRVAGSVALDTPMGKLPAMHLVKQRDAGDNNEIEVWLAAERSYVPVKLLIVESDGTRYEQIITRLETR